MGFDLRCDTRLEHHHENTYSSSIIRPPPHQLAWCRGAAYLRFKERPRVGKPEKGVGSVRPSVRVSVIKNAGPRLSRRESRGCCGGWPAVHGGSQHARPGCSAEAVSRLDGAVWPVSKTGWRQLRRCVVGPHWPELRAGASGCKLACRKAARIAFLMGLARIGDGLAWYRCKLVDSICV